MSFYKNRGLVAAIEELEDQLNQTDPELGAPENAGPQEVVQFNDLENSPEANEGELIEDAVELDVMDDQLEAGSDAIDELGDHIETVERIQEEEGGLDEESAEVLQTSLESIYNRLGFPSNQETLPSLENFGGISSRMRATEVSLESMKDRLVKSVKAVVKWVKEQVRKIYEFFAQYIRQVDRYDRRVKSLQSKLKDLEGQAPADARIESARIARGLTLTGAVPRPVDVRRSIQEAHSVLDSFLGYAEKNDENDQKDLADLLAEFARDTPRKNRVHKIFEDFVKRHVEQTKTFLNVRGQGGFQTDVLPGGRVLRLVTSEKKKFLGVAGPIVTGFKFEMDAPVKPSVGEGNLEVLSHNQCSNILSECGKVIGSVRQIRGLSKKLNDSTNKMLDKLEETVEKNRAEGSRSDISQVATASAKLIPIKLRGIRIYSSYMMGVVSVSLNWVERSMREHSKAA